MKVRRLFISPGHNFFGRSEPPAGIHPTIEVQTIECVAGHGISGDRFFDFKPDYKGQVTFFSLEVFNALSAALNLTGKSPGDSRRNIIVEGVDLNALIGKEFQVQGVTFLGTAECSPCHWMDRAFGAGAEDFLQQRGGLRAKILTSGTLRVE